MRIIEKFSVFVMDSGQNFKRSLFLAISFGLVVLLFAWLILDYMEFLFRDPSNAIIHNNWIGILILGIYFAVAYSMIFVKAWAKTRPAEQAWPSARCYGLLLWTLLTILPSYPLIGQNAVRIHVVTCIVVGILFLVRMIIGKMRNESGWIWQIYAVTYICLELILPRLAVDILL